MTYAADRHRRLDQQAAQAAGDAPGHALLPGRYRGRDARSLSGEAKVLLAELTERSSASGRRYLKGWVGASNLIAFEGEPDAEGRPTWRLYLTERPAATRTTTT